MLLFEGTKYAYIKGRYTYDEAVDKCYNEFLGGYPAQIKDEYEMSLADEYMATKNVDRDVWIGQTPDNDEYYRYFPYDSFNGK